MRLFIVKEIVNANKKHIWGTFYWSDKSKSTFEMKKGQSWFQWGSMDNMMKAGSRIEKLCNDWLDTVTR